jgi:ferric-dicitrate binding protein FerR (iron transport regulator)
MLCEEVQVERAGSQVADLCQDYAKRGTPQAKSKEAHTPASCLDARARAAAATVQCMVCVAVLVVWAIYLKPLTLFALISL